MPSDDQTPPRRPAAPSGAPRSGSSDITQDSSTGAERTTNTQATGGRQAPIKSPAQGLAGIAGQLQMTIVSKIAAGGMGAVYRAIQHGAEGFSKSVAVKTILGSYSGSDDFNKMFIGEAKLVADLVHQNIAQVYQLGRDRGLLYIVMENVEGVNLGQFNQRHRVYDRKLPYALAAYITSRICRGLEYAHNKRGRDGKPLGLVHRDVSPSNLMITELGEIKILDFGIAKAAAVTFSHSDNVVLGKRAYIAPEQVALEPVDRRADLFSAGLILWELMAGCPVMTADGKKRKESDDFRTPIAPIAEQVSDAPPMLVDIVKRATQLDPADRYEDAGKMGYDLEYFMYHKGYGPTIVTMERYLREVFPDRPWSDGASLPHDGAGELDGPDDGPEEDEDTEPSATHPVEPAPPEEG